MSALGLLIIIHLAGCMVSTAIASTVSKEKGPFRIYILVVFGLSGWAGVGFSIGQIWKKLLEWESEGE